MVGDLHAIDLFTTDCPLYHRVEFIDLLFELLAQVGLVDGLEVAQSLFVDDRPNERYTVPVAEQVLEKLLLGFVVVVLVFLQTFFHVLLGGELLAFAVDHFQREIPEDPEESGLAQRGVH